MLQGHNLFKVKETHRSNSFDKTELNISMEKNTCIMQVYKTLDESTRFIQSQQTETPLLIQLTSF